MPNVKPLNAVQAIRGRAVNEQNGKYSASKDLNALLQACAGSCKLSGRLCIENLNPVPAAAKLSQHATESFVQLRSGHSAVFHESHRCYRENSTSSGSLCTACDMHISVHAWQMSPSLLLA